MKRFKIYSLIIALIAMVSVSCDPLEDEINEIEANVSITKDIEYTLTEDDYDLADEECDCASGNFGNEDDVKTYVPLILENNFPALGNRSSALVTYDFYQGGNEAVDQYADAERYVLMDADYTSATAEAGAAGFFNNSTRVEDYISDILNTNVTSPIDGQLVAATFKESSFGYAEFTFSENFDGGDLTGMDPISISGDETWEWGSSSSGYRYAAMSGNNDGNQVNEDWLITPELDLTGRSGGTTTLRLRHVLAFFDAPGAVGTDIAVMVSTDYDGANPGAATWDNITANFDQFPTGEGADFGQYYSTVNLAAYEGMQIYIGFYYNSTEDYAPLWRVIDVDVDNGSPVEIITKNAFYSYNESTDFWTEADGNAYFLSSADFESMGGLTNFGSSISPDNYLPQFLKSFFPYAQEEDEQIIIYDYVSSSSGAQVRGDFYTYLSGEWVKHDFVIETTLNFGHDGTNWVPDNTIKYTFTTADFAVAGDEANGLGNAAARDNLRTFGNFGTQWSHEEIIEAIGFVLKLNFPSSEVGQKYLVTYNTFPAGDLTALLILDASGDYLEVTD